MGLTKLLEEPHKSFRRAHFPTLSHKITAVILGPFFNRGPPQFSASATTSSAPESAAAATTAELAETLGFHSKDSSAD